jgi:hypothetical protein
LLTNIHGTLILYVLTGCHLINQSKRNKRNKKKIKKTVLQAVYLFWILINYRNCVYSKQIMLIK